jgi:roadblock/LC7 domain-containing protein
MSTLDELMSLPGVYGAIEFSCTGELARYGELGGILRVGRADVRRQYGDLSHAGHGWTKLTGQKGFRRTRFAFVTLDPVVMGMDGNAILAHSKNFDYDAAYQRFNASA